MGTCCCLNQNTIFNLDKNLEELSKLKCKECGKIIFTKKELVESKKQGYVKLMPYNFFIGTKREKQLCLKSPN